VNAFTFHPEAEAEFLAAIDYYQAADPGLGADFAAEVHETVQNILAYPAAWPVLRGDVRRCVRQVRDDDWCESRRNRRSLTKHRRQNRRP
jgi:hypothetical protein